MKFAVGNFVLLSNKNTAQILEVRRNAEYYIHTLNTDRRLDRWVAEDDILDIALEYEPEQEIIDQAELDRIEMTKIRTIEQIQFAEFRITTWYFSPYPEEFKCLPLVYICPVTFKYFRNKASYMHYQAHVQPSIPGIIVYQDPIADLFFYRVDGKTDKLFCQNLCLFAKLYLDHKTVYFDIVNFYFYLLVCEGRIVGYFSKEKQCAEGYNLACILVFPPFQRRGYGRILIEFSYELSKSQGVAISGPERPISDLGMAGYLSYWQAVILSTLQSNPKAKMSLAHLEGLTGIYQEDLLVALSSLGLLKYWKRDGELCITPEQIEEQIVSKRPNLRRSICSETILVTFNEPLKQAPL